MVALLYSMNCFSDDGRPANDETQRVELTEAPKYLSSDRLTGGDASLRMAFCVLPAQSRLTCIRAD